MSNTQPQALRLADALEQAPVHTQEDGTVLLYLGGTVVADKAAAELRRLHDLLGKANALARIRAAEIESLKASLYGLYELEKQRDELEQRLTKTEAQLGEAVWNYGELKREQLANQQKTSGSPNEIANEARLHRAVRALSLQTGADAQETVDWLCNGGLAEMALSHFGDARRKFEDMLVAHDITEQNTNPQRWAVFCGGCRNEWTLPYAHPGKSICAECEAKLKAKATGGAV